MSDPYAEQAVVDWFEKNMTHDNFGMCTDEEFATSLLAHLEEQGFVINPTVERAWGQLRDDLLDTLHIPQFVDWLSKRLTRG